MLDAAELRKVPQTNAAVDAEKVKERVDALWKNASAEEKKTTLELTGLSRSMLYRVMKNGRIGARLALGLAQTLNVDPRHITGASDERGVCSEEHLNAFLAELPESDSAADDTGEDEIDQQFEETADEAKREHNASLGDTISPEAQKLMDGMTADEAALLLRAAFVQAKANVPGAVETVAALKRLLLPVR